jgi:hypothetical protein
LRRVRITRADLFTSDETRKAITFHDLRGTGITWCAVRGDDALKIKQRAGHASFSTTEGYIREAENMRAGFGAVFPRLPAGLLSRGPVRPTLNRRPAVSASVPAFGVAGATTRGKTRAIGSGRRDLNGHQVKPRPNARGTGKSLVIVPPDAPRGNPRSREATLRRLLAGNRRGPPERLRAVVTSDVRRRPRLGSMATSIVYSSIFGTMLASLRSVTTRRRAEGAAERRVLQEGRPGG